MKFTTNGGGNAQKFADFLNRLFSGSLAKFISGTRGIEVTARSNGGVSLRALAPLVQYFYLTDEHPTDFTARQGRSVSAGMGDAADDGTEPPAPETTVPFSRIHFMYTTGWFAKGRVVRCEDSTGRWECNQPGVRYVKGTVTTISGPNITVTLSGGTHLLGTTTSVVAKEPWFDIAVSDAVGLEWNDTEQCFDIGKKVCDPDDPDEEV